MNPGVAGKVNSPSKITLGIIAPMKREAACITSENIALGHPRRIGEDLFLHCSGIGLAGAERAARGRIFLLGETESKQERAARGLVMPPWRAALPG